jgi:hypothetical protein
VSAVAHDIDISSTSELIWKGSRCTYLIGQADH